jgi:hypothetical protein
MDLDYEYNLVQDCETGLWRGDVTRFLYGEPTIFPAIGDSIDEVVEIKTEATVSNL